MPERWGGATVKGVEGGCKLCVLDQKGGVHRWCRDREEQGLECWGQSPEKVLEVSRGNGEGRGG